MFFTRQVTYQVSEDSLGGDVAEAPHRPGETVHAVRIIGLVEHGRDHLPLEVESVDGDGLAPLGSGGYPRRSGVHFTYPDHFHSLCEWVTIDFGELKYYSTIFNVYYNFRTN